MSSIDKQSLANTKAPPFSYRGIPNMEHKIFLILGDILVLSVAAWASYMAWNAFAPAINQVPLFWAEFVLLLIGWWSIASMNDLYDPFVSSHRVLLTKSTLVTSVMVYIVLAMLSAILYHGSLGGFQLTWTAIALLAVSGWRIQYSALANTRRFRRRMLIIGHGRRAQAAAELTRRSSKLYDVKGYVLCHADATDNIVDGLSVWTSEEELISLVEQQMIDTIVVATDDELDEQRALALLECQTLGIEVLWLPELFERLCHKIPIDLVDPTWMFYAMQSSPSRMKVVGKQLLDWILIFMALPSLLVLFPALAFLVKLSSPGAIFYRQTRCGYRGKEFTIYKFRTMYEDAEKDGKPQWAINGDPRITRIGRILRKTHLDELPQLFNILRGEMSLVGPRPERPEFVMDLEKQIPFYRTRLFVKPGLTGWAQVKYDYGNSVEDARRKLECDCYYVRNWSLWFDISILVRTISVAVRGTGT